MKFPYLLAVSSSRIVTLMVMLALSHILAGSEFGRYSVLAINALLVHSLTGNWLAMAATQALATSKKESIEATLVKIMKIAVCIMLVQCGLAIFVIILNFVIDTGFGLNEVLAIFSFVLAMLLFDIATAANNALGDDGHYLRFNIFRNVGGGLLSLFFAWLSSNGLVAIAGQTLGIMLAFALSPMALLKWRHVISQFPRTKLQREDWISMSSFGVTGSLALGLLVFVNSLIRNFVFWTHGAKVAGTFSLISDFFYAPLVLLGTSFSLSKMRELYQLHRSPQPERLAHYRQFNGAIGFLVIPYAIGGFWTAPWVASLLVPLELRQVATAIAGISAVQAAVLTIISTVVTILLTAGLKRKVMATATLTIICIAISCVVGSALHTPQQFAAATLVGSFVAAVISMFILGPKAFPWTGYAKTLIASVAMVVVVIPILSIDSMFAPPLAIAGGVLVFSLFTFILRISLWRDFIPTDASNGARDISP